MPDESLLATIGGRFLLALLPTFRPQTDYHYLFLGGFLLTAVAVYAARRKQLAGQKFFAFLFPRASWTHASTRLDLKLLFANGMLALYFFGLEAWTSDAVGNGLAKVFGPSPGLAADRLAVVLAGTLLLGLAADLGFYAGHWLLHRVPVLWEFHKVHHSAPVLTPITASRQHPLDALLSGLIIAGLTGCVAGAFKYLWPGFAALELNAHNLVEFLFVLTFLHFRHSHIWINWWPWLSRILISPAQHQIHHSADPAHYGRNFGVIFALWDWAFGTLYIPRGRERLTFGLGPEAERNFRSLGRCWLMPFVAAWQLIRTAISRRVPLRPERRSAPP